MFIQTETTPNPKTLKFLPGQSVHDGDGLELTTVEQAQSSPLAKALFAIDGVESVYFGPDFISITKNDVDWLHIKPLILGSIMEHYLSGAPLLSDGAAMTSAEEFFDAADGEIVATIKDLLETRVRPAVAGDGGDIVFRGFKDGTVFLAMKGACSGCPSSTATLKHGVQNLLQHFVPEVRAVESI